MQNLFRNQFVVGLLLMFVLAFGGQGVCEALTLAKESGDYQSKPAEATTTFEITFSVTLDSDTTKRYNSLGYQIDEYGNEIDSSGYLVEYIGSSARRFISASDITNANNVSSAISIGTGGYNVTSLSGSPTLKVKTAGDRSSSLGSFGDQLETSPGDQLYVDSSKNVVDSQNRAVYVEESNNESGDDERWKYTRAKADPVIPYTKTAPQRYAYNDEQIQITSSGVATVQMLDGGRTYTLSGAVEAAGEILEERDKSRGIPRRITLRITPSSTAGTHTVTISDFRANDRANDYPLRKPDVTPITFTLYTTNEPAAGDTITATDRFISTTQLTLRIDDDYTLPEQRLISYQVLSGPATLYKGILDAPVEPASKSLIAASGTDDTTDDHVNTPVYLYLNRGESRVRAYVDGGHPEDGVTITYDYTGTDRVDSDSGGRDDESRDNNNNPVISRRGSLDIFVSGTGSTRTVTVTAQDANGSPAPGIGVQLTTTGGSLSSLSGVTPFTSTLTLPSAADTYTLTATTAVPSYDGDTASVTVTLPGTLLLEEIGLRAENGGQSIRVTVREANGVPASGNVPVTLSGAVSRIVDTTNGTGAASIVLPTTGGPYSVTLRSPGYNDGFYTFSVAGQSQPTGQQPTTTTRGPAGVADSIEIDGSRSIDGTLAQAMRLRTQVLDANDDGVSGVDVTFEVLAPGRGTFVGARGSGRAIRVSTDRNGYASTRFTPTSEGDVIVQAKAARVAAAVTFIIDVGEGSEDTRTEDTETPDPIGPRTYEVGDKISISLQDTLIFAGSRTINGTVYTCAGSGECVVSYGTLVKGEIRAVTAESTAPPTTPVTVGPVADPEVRIAASNRPVIYWIAGGALYQLAGATTTQIAANATDVAVDVDGGNLYWIAQTSQRTGAIHRANLDGSNAEVLKPLTSAPQGLALDPAAKKVYLTNNWGKIQRINVDGTGFETNFITELADPQHIAVSEEYVYWTEANGNVKYMPLRGQKTIQSIVTGSGTLGDIVANGSEVYWTEQTGSRSGKIWDAEVDNIGVRDPDTLYTITATVHGLAIDPANNQLYWTNGWGKVQRGVNGSRFQDVLTGLITPTVMAIGDVNTETPSTPRPTTTAGTSKYDVNADGSVDSTDVDMLLLAVLAELSDAKYDVNSDGSVDVLDVKAVNGNLDAGAPGAPTLLGKQFSAFEVNRLQEQVELLIATNDRSPVAMKTLIYLQQLIAMARPEKTQLLANYPNPFNPETWIPYELATDTDVRITIYTSTGVVVRTLQLGYQSAGYYTDRERAAYWDGRNTLGERVASGVYFYQLETDTQSPLMRKMVILK